MIDSSNTSSVVASKRELDADRAAAEADQTAADKDQTSSDEDESAAAVDQAGAEGDQRASDRDQATADRDRAARHTPADERAYDASRSERIKTTTERLGTRLERARTARVRDDTALDRDRSAAGRDAIGTARDERAANRDPDATDSNQSLVAQLAELRAQAAADRARAAADRERAAEDRAKAARERERLEAALHSAHLDELTGAYRREMGRLAISHEIDRSRRSDGQFVMAFVDVDDFKAVNDRLGHAAGDRVLQIVVAAIRARFRSFDPIVRYGGDEFVCGVTGIDLAEAERRFALIRAATEADAGVTISVGLAALEPGDTPERLAERADAAMLRLKAHRHARMLPSTE